MAVVYFRINHKGREVTIRENYILHSKLEWKLSELFCAAGLKKKGEPLKMCWNQLPGKTGMAKVGLRPGTKDASKMFNFIDKLYAKEAQGFQPGRF